MLSAQSSFETWVLHKHYFIKKERKKNIYRGVITTDESMSLCCARIIDVDEKSGQCTLVYEEGK